MNTLEYFFCLIWYRRSDFAFKDLELNKDFEVRGYEYSIFSDSVFMHFFKSKTIDVRLVEVHKSGRELTHHTNYSLESVRMKNCIFSYI